MSAAADGPGKTAPKLLHDFLHFDPLKVENNRNLLKDHPPPVGEGLPLTSTGQIGACRHEYTLKPNQSLLPPTDHRPDASTIYKTAVVCKKCRLHADVRLTFADATHACPHSEYPLHHFQLLTGQDAPTHDRIRYKWRCSGPLCAAQLQITFRLPRLSLTDRHVLADAELLRRRYEEVLQDDPTRTGVTQTTPMEAYNRLRRYLSDALDIKHTKRKIPSNQKLFISAFGLEGRDCSELLQRLGFQYEEDAWVIPSPPALSEEERLFAEGRSAREYLEDVHIELLACMCKLSADTSVPNMAAAEGWPVADLAIKRVLGAQGYPTHLPFRRGQQFSPDSQYYIASLGALPDFDDAMMGFAYDRQSLCDSERTSYYFECLQVISELRGSEDLQMKVVLLSSQDVVSRRDINAAYRLLNINPAEASAYTDERILDLFQVRQSDLGIHAQEEARQALNRVGLARGSLRLINASRQTIETYEDALTWIGNGVTKETTDEGLLAVIGLRMDEDRSSDEVARKAISVIAQARKSSYLNNWLLTGRSDGFEMGTDEALRILGIDQNFSALDLAILPAVFDTARSDRPGDQTEKAIAVLQKAMAGGEGTQRRAPETWPVGLRSHGNTCYLNSLLQYYFSITPLRNIILDYEQYALDTAKFTEKHERVGQRKISMVEIKGGQRFADDLAKLFRNMISEAGESVMPEEALVCRAFLEPKDYELLTPPAPASSPRPGTTLEKPIEPVDEKMTDYVEVSAPSASDADEGYASNASSTTLQGSVDGEEQMKTAASLHTPPDSPAVPPTAASKPIADSDMAPPLPPRRASTTKDEALRKAESHARQQQDVTEVHDGVMFRLRSGMTPRGMDEREEQYDELRSLFSIALAETPVKDGVEGKKKVLLDSSLQLNVPNEPKDLYSALDEIFDLQAYDDSALSAMETFKSITDLPPLLQINIPRIGYDSTTRNTYKANATIRLEEDLFLDRYVDDPATSEQVLPLRRKSWGWRKHLHSLKKERQALAKTPLANIDGPTAVTQAADYLNSVQSINAELEAVGLEPIALDADLPSALTVDARHQTERLATLDSQIAATATQMLPPDAFPRKRKYRLAVVFFHRGDYGHGHYWIYIRDFAAKLWRKYNDERVEEFPESQVREILEASEWSHGTPTYAVYVRDDVAAEVVQPVCRAPVQLQSEASAAPLHGEAEEQVMGPGGLKLPSVTTVSGNEQRVEHHTGDKWEEEGKNLATQAW